MLKPIEHNDSGEVLAPNRSVGNRPESNSGHEAKQLKPTKKQKVTRVGTHEVSEGNLRTSKWLENRRKRIT